MPKIPVLCDTCDGSGLLIVNIQTGQRQSLCPECAERAEKLHKETTSTTDAKK